MTNYVNPKKLLQKGHLDNLFVSDFIVYTDYHKIGMHHDVNAPVDLLKTKGK